MISLFENSVNSAGNETGCSPCFVLAAFENSVYSAGNETVQIDNVFKSQFENSVNSAGNETTCLPASLLCCLRTLLILQVMKITVQ